MTTATASPAVDKRVSGSAKKPPRPGLVCFSFAAYGKAVVAHLRASGVPVASGLSDAEFAAVESAYGFKFPPDLRSVLLEGLPIGPGFPNWRSASPQQLRLLLGLPTAGLLHEISSAGFWPRAWEPQPRDCQAAVAAAETTLRGAPRLVPVYRHFYVPAAPCLAGNPVFYVRGREVRPAGLDLADFFRRERPRGWAVGVPAPAWAATSARRVEMWTELAEGSARWEREQSRSAWEARVEERLEAARRQLRDGGWSEKEITEMLAEEGPGSEGCDRVWAADAARPAAVREREDVWRQMWLLSLAMARGGWSADDVTESMGWKRDDRTK